LIDALDIGLILQSAGGIKLGAERSGNGETDPISLQQFERDWYRVLANFGGPPKQQAPSALEPNPNPFNDEKEHLSGRCSDLPLTGERHHPFRPSLNKRFTVKRRVDEHH
jgi:hypothetical protein